MTPDRVVPVRHEADVLAARQAARVLAEKIGFSETELTLIATAISEIARNVITYGKGGEMALEVVTERARRGIVITARDQGPGIPDIERAMQDGFSTGNGLGLGLMDDFHIQSVVGSGTTIVMKKWKR
jgi:serine/threonine-protein kinase RsbT